MNLADGKIINSQAADAVLSQLPQRILRTLEKAPLEPEIVIQACDRLVANLDEEAYLAIMSEIGIGRQRGRAYLEEAKTVFSAPYLRTRMAQEPGAAVFGSTHLPDHPTQNPVQMRPAQQKGELNPVRPVQLAEEPVLLESAQPVHGLSAVCYRPPFHDKEIKEQIHPLGVLVHIPAGNADGLPAFSVLEGLLTGNINVLKLPEVDGGISVLLLEALVQQEPVLAEYIYVFDYSSRDTESVAKLIDVADAVVVWGGDAALSALRQLIPPNIKLIEWGHKVSFAYATESGRSSSGLEALARHICETNQLLCTSCQGIYLDTIVWEDIEEFCHLFLPFLEAASVKIPKDFGLGAQAQVTLQLRTLELEGPREGSRLFRGCGVSLLASRDSALEPSLQFRNCWVKPLPKEQLIKTLRPHKNHLQTVGLLCDPEEEKTLASLFVKTGVVRITSPANMSSTYCGAPHDGEYALRRYTKTVSFE